ncbi:hypothetical protein RGQ29_014650 [Quercus rubra]|uniref:non-specific serine/threonine protein kinase n=1 Tax=Quercus rubra TaxID=3512 RepID=A0AAN7FSZ2_QUERU|nr:hypothetical protein RGQ29_014650 [Quercus rubra]
MPTNSAGGYLGLFSNESALNATENQIVAVEFDTYQNGGDPRANHVGIDVNSIVSDVNVTWNGSFSNTANAWVSYNSTTKTLSVFLTFADNPVFNGNSSLSYIVDLMTVLPEWVSVGFSAATGVSIETHTILSWSFNSTSDPNDGNRKNKLALIIGLALSFGVVSCALGLLWFICWRKRANGNTQNFGDDVCMDIEFEKGTGPKSFTYREIIHATNNFAEGGKLGEGGFGGVYKGLLSESNAEVAVKRVSKGSKQGKKEYMSEVTIISHLRHKNLVQLIGWCHEQGELLLVYEYMPNGSLDTHLFGVEITLIWPVRYKIALGLASALLYLHEEWQQCVIHRDIKSRNIMLDSNFNAKLGNFGLARLVDQELGSQTTVLAGTMGYLVPECVITSKVSKESDVYSFGVVSLEIACGRKPVQPQAEPNKVSLVEWVWNLYGKDQLIEAVDKRLSMEYDEEKMERLMVVGLWYCHPDPTIRPSIRQVINVLSFETPLPILPSKLPVPMYVEPPIDICRLSYTSTSITGSMKGQTLCSCSSCSTNSSTLVSPSKPLLNSSKGNVEFYIISSW